MTMKMTWVLVLLTAVLTVATVQAVSALCFVLKENRGGKEKTEFKFDFANFLFKAAIPALVA
jgi:hypothetical protein